jgi:hypothetical protein
MGAGKAGGKDREYQILAKDILSVLMKQGMLIPFCSDGIDVKIPMGGTEWTLDVLLKDQEGARSLL